MIPSSLHFRPHLNQRKTTIQSKNLFKYIWYKTEVINYITEIIYLLTVEPVNLKEVKLLNTIS